MKCSVTTAIATVPPTLPWAFWLTHDESGEDDQSFPGGCGPTSAEVQLLVDNGNIGVTRGLETREQARFLLIVDQATPTVLVKDTKFVAVLGDISSDILLLPTSTGLLQGLEKRGEVAVASEGGADLWPGTWNDEQLALVYEWGHKRNIMQYLKLHSDASRPELANGLISETGKAQVCDYGLTPITSNPPTASKSADMFAFTTLAVEAFTEKSPFEDTGNMSAAIQITMGKKPAKPQTAEQLGLTTEIWKFIEKCWSADPNERPTINEVVSIWEGFINEHTVLS
ncbi:hypothetical protein BDM02DRAFT_3259721 [Thelephora ganbajun]|uniref:Uncharacterized protein n=1 Tax=Thelephora ganbajun TaxID=370292 RepID=A0ACB6ZLN7_THEGA|nr:hypothetical protein BDM02DRAFT_3259721 [Thelephora ganbajun]